MVKNVSHFIESVYIVFIYSQLSSMLHPEDEKKPPTFT